MKKSMIVFLVLILFSFSLGIKCEAQSQFSNTLTRIEKSLYGIDYSTQTDETRLKRIEESVYGSTSSSPVQTRIGKLTKDLSADLIGQEIKPKTDTFSEEDDDKYKEPIPKADSNINYPSVNELEKAVFNNEYRTTDIKQRLNNLEQKVFKKAYNDDDLNTRVDRLKQAVIPQKIAKDEDDLDSDNANGYDYNSLMNQTSQFQDNGYNTPSLFPNFGRKLAQGSTGFGSQIPQDFIGPSYNENNSVLDDYPNNTDLAIPLSDLEKKVLKKSFPNETNSNRLIRMELKVFNSTFTEDDEQTRYDRIASAYQAKKSSSRYDNNKFSQHAATAMQVGAILLMILAAIL